MPVSSVTVFDDSISSNCIDFLRVSEPSVFVVALIMAFVFIYFLLNGFTETPNIKITGNALIVFVNIIFVHFIFSVNLLLIYFRPPNLTDANTEFDTLRS